ncbi:NAD(P)/FAD-dependent oxidoreductase [Paenisporosarcina sp. TG20]|uniref:dihydrolipoyl dehydrogenase family protein n=1 Tax=Paenisporosarcina sp. TG20 TaxID=1211706 RepID=UPI000311FD83|nr:NAD(P)/FAD-dependent oxidoreductase [Paenisporosarcina sp. TG20]
MNKSYDLIVIGSGSGGSVSAGKARNEGWSVAVIDSHPFGGTCANRGCDPKKVLVGAAELIDWNTRMQDHGIVEATSINWSLLMKFKRTFTDSVPENKEKSFHNKGIDTYHGKAAFTGEKEITVDNNVLTGKFILIASGAEPTPLSIEGEEFVKYSDDFLEFDELPKKIVFIGGGFISFEFAHIAARAGAEVHIIHRSEKLLKGFDQDLVNLLIKKSEEIGITIHLETTISKIEKTSENLLLTLNNKGNVSSSLTASSVIHGAGRIPAIKGLDLDKGNVKFEKEGITVNQYLQSISNPAVYAAGDVSATIGAPLTPLAGMESHIVAANILNGNHKTPEYVAIPSTVFTIPKLSAVGMSEDEAKKLDRNIKVNYFDTSQWFTYRRTNEKYAAVKVIIDEDSDLILGAHLLSGVSDELINHFATAIRQKTTTANLKKMIFSYPTAASDISYMI